MRQLILLLLVFVGSITSVALGAELSDFYFVDAHSQADSEDVLARVIPLMDRAGVRRTILSARGKLTSEEIARFAGQHPSRITAAVRTKGGAYIKNAKRYYKNLERDAESGQYGAIAELLLYHAQKGNKVPEVTVYPDDERVQRALSAAKSNGWPLVLHIEFASLSGGEKSRYMQKLGDLLSDNQNHPFAMIHMAQLQLDDVQRLITSHKNIFFMTSHTNPVTTRSSSQPWTRMFNGDVLTADWARILTQHPDRFIFAMDNVWADHWGDYYVEGVQYWRKALAGLPAQVAHAVAHGNAERLWKLKKKPVAYCLRHSSR